MRHFLLFTALLLPACTTPPDASRYTHPDTEEGLRLYYGTTMGFEPGPRDTVEGRRLLVQAYEDGDATAARWLGTQAMGRGDSAASRAYFRTAAARGDTAAYMWEGLTYLTNRPPFERDLVQFVRVAHNAAQSGNPQARQSLANTYDGLRRASADGTPEADSVIVLLEASGLWPDDLR